MENDENNGPINVNHLISDSDSNLIDSRPPAKPPDVDCKSDVNEVADGVVDDSYDIDNPVPESLPTLPTLDSNIEFPITICVFLPFFNYPISSSPSHSSKSEDVIFDPGIFAYLPGCHFICFTKDE